MSPRLALAKPRPLGRWALAIFCSVVTEVAAAQSRPRTVVAADSAFSAGNVELAESLYYVGARQRPRDPLVREALGKFLGAQGKAKVAVVLLEEARLFGGDPARIGLELAPLYQYLGDWRALLTLPGSPLNAAERRRAAYLADHPFGTVSDAAGMTLIGAPKGDTIARAAVRVGDRTAVASIVATDVGITLGSRLVGDEGRHFDGDSSVIVLDSMSIGTLRLVNVPATIGGAPGAIVIGVAALNRLMPTIDYGRNRIAFSRTDGGAAQSRVMLVRTAGELRILDRGRWISLGAFAPRIANAKGSMTIDLRAGEVRIRASKPPPN